MERLAFIVAVVIMFSCSCASAPPVTSSQEESKTVSCSPEEKEFLLGHWEGSWHLPRYLGQVSGEINIFEVSGGTITATVSQERVVIRDKEKAKIMRRDDG